MSIQHKAASLHPREDSHSSKIGQSTEDNTFDRILYPNFLSQLAHVILNVLVSMKVLPLEILKPDNKSPATVAINTRNYAFCLVFYSLVISLIVLIVSLLTLL